RNPKFRNPYFSSLRISTNITSLQPLFEGSNDVRSPGNS
ncbi:hypothetical protein LINGRAHAP2_LOCUS34490, partial [Linum grandiflorum]